MNAERLHAITLALAGDFSETEVALKLDQLVGALQNLVNQPNPPQHQTAVSQQKAELIKAAESSAFESYPPTWRQVIDELGLTSILGQNLARTVNEIFGRNQITPSVALDEVKNLKAQFDAAVAKVNALNDSFGYFQIGSEKLAPGECEICVLIPRQFVDNNLKDFSGELKTLNSTFNVFSEIAVGERDRFSIRTISSSDLSVYLASVPAVCWMVAHAIDRIADLYIKLLKIKELRSKLADEGVSDRDLAGVEDHANNFMGNGIDNLVNELMNEFYKANDDGRRHELEINLKISCKRIANRLDRGFNIDVRMAEPIRDEQKMEGGAANEDLHAVFNRIQSASNGARFIKTDGAPILHLEEARANNEPEGDNSQDR